MNFSRKDVQNFSTLRHLLFERDISTTVAPNQMSPGPLETRHPEFSVHIKLEENGAQKFLITST